MRILAVSGSLQARSSNLSLLQAAPRLAPPGVEITLFDGVRHLPHFDPDLEHGDPPPPVALWRAAIAQSDALLIASPEYGHSLPGSLKNAIDWLIGSGELESKVVGITACTPAPERGRRGLHALSVTLAAVNARIVGGDPIVRGPSLDADLAHLLRAIATAVSTSPDSALA